ncbi:hypothetical protein F5X68DRAFT_205208 [Plectosphaerella plurivora]|uniref:ERF1 methyltransferase catalytic subunit MTQ2 n=1 Tax=Plectosphaerella plurivora TaxID=936078 RepID=A0A9P8VEF6_9PEZI|nr:hypothetical protein F5X68DRAFT_205208 [Plectosphaerella plurivora]
MLPTPDTSHVPYERVYEPAEDSYLLLDTLSAPAETAFLQSRFGPQQHSGAPLVVEIGPGSGVVIAFVVAQAQRLFGTRDVLAAAVDVNSFACGATNGTVKRAQTEEKETAGRCWLGSVRGDLVGPLRHGCVDVLIFNPPYVPSDEMPVPPATWSDREDTTTGDSARKPTFDEDSYLLALSYAGGVDGMETTNRLLESLPETLSDRGCAYVLLCARNKPDEVKQRVMAMGPEWRALTVGDSGKKAGWEKLQIVRIWRENASDI